MRDFPDYVGYYAIKKYRYAGTPAANDSNRNLPAVSRPDGGRPENRPHRGRGLLPGGHGANASYPNLAPGGRRLLSVVLGAASENGTCQRIPESC